jgi:hypothetical protein
VSSNPNRREQNRRRDITDRVQRREHRRLQRARRKRIRRGILFGFAAVVAVALVAGLFIADLTGGIFGPGGGSAPEDVGQRVELGPGSTQHVADGTVVDYASNPPAGGPHYGTWVRAGIYPSPVIVGQAVHSMEHGHVVLWHNTDDPELVNRIEQFAADLPDAPRCLVVTPYPQMDEGTVIAMTGWGRILKLEAFDEEQMSDFARAYRGRASTAEGDLCWRE